MRISFESLRATYNELIEDVEHPKRLDERLSSDSFIKRTYVRAFFAMIEGVIYQFKQIALEANMQSKVFESFEVDLLREKAALLKDNGTVGEKAAKLGLLPNVQFSFLSVAKALKTSFELSKGPGFNSLRIAIVIRDRITHPKSLANLQVSGDDMAILGEANEWFRDEVVRLIDSIHPLHDVE